MVGDLKNMNIEFGPFMAKGLRRFIMFYFVRFTLLSLCFAPLTSRADMTPTSELNVWVMSTTAQPQQDMKEILRPFLLANPHLRVNVTVLNWESAWAKINAAADSGQGPDVVELGSTWVASILSKNVLEAVPSDLMKSLGGQQQFLPALWSSSHLYRDERVYALPWYGGARVAFYRTDLFKQAGIRTEDAFANWGSFKQAMRKLQSLKVDGKPIAALGYPGKHDWDILHNLAPWIWNAGGDFLSKDQTRSSINSPETLQAITFFKSFAEEGLVPTSALEKDSAQIEMAFFRGEFAVIFSGPWVLKVLSTEKAKGGQKESHTAANFSVAPYPAGIRGNQTLFSGSNLAVMKSSKNKEEAWRLLQFLMSREVQVKYSLLSGMLPARVDALHDPSLLKVAHYADFLEQIKLGRHYPVVPAWGKLENVFRSSIGQVMTANAKPNDSQPIEKLSKETASTIGVGVNSNAFSIKKILDKAAYEADQILKAKP